MRTCASTEGPIRVLIVDDHPSMLWGLRKLVESAAPRLALAGTAVNRSVGEALLERCHIDVVLLDIELGDDCGIDLLPAIVRHGARAIMLSATRGPEVRRRAMLAGARGYLHKSSDTEAILTAIEQVHAGRLWMADEDMACLLAEPPAAAGRGPDELTPAERKVVAAVVTRRGSPNKVIADALHISTHTLRNHLASVYSKLGLHSRMDLVFYAKDRRI